MNILTAFCRAIKKILLSWIKNDYEAKQKNKKDPQFFRKYLWIRSVKLYKQDTGVDIEEEPTTTRKLTQKEKEAID